jgi:hypothetical protein
MSSPKTFEEMVDSILREARELIIQRHRKYGRKNISRHLLPGIATRLDDKICRLNNGLENMDDETIEQTLDDVIGYGVIGKAVERGWWTKTSCPPLGPIIDEESEN